MNLAVFHRDCESLVVNVDGQVLYQVQCAPGSARGVFGCEYPIIVERTPKTNIFHHCAPNGMFSTNADSVVSPILRWKDGYLSFSGGSLCLSTNEGQYVVRCPDWATCVDVDELGRVWVGGATWRGASFARLEAGEIVPVAMNIALSWRAWFRYYLRLSDSEAAGLVAVGNHCALVLAGMSFETSGTTLVFGGATLTPHPIGDRILSRSADGRGFWIGLPGGLVHIDGSTSTCTMLPITEEIRSEAEVPVGTVADFAPVMTLIGPFALVAGGADGTRVATLLKLTPKPSAVFQTTTCWSVEWFSPRTPPLVSAFQEGRRRKASSTPRQYE